MQRDNANVIVGEKLLDAFRRDHIVNLDRWEAEAGRSFGEGEHVVRLIAIAPKAALGPHRREGMHWSRQSGRGHVMECIRCQGHGSDAAFRCRRSRSSAMTMLIGRSHRPYP